MSSYNAQRPPGSPSLLHHRCFVRFLVLVRVFRAVERFVADRLDFVVLRFVLAFDLDFARTRSGNSFRPVSRFHSS
jgi:hypothetical protein